MKRPGDIQLNQPPSKHYKSVTFSLPSPNNQQQINPKQQQELESTSSTSRQISPSMTGQSSLQHPPSSSSLQQTIGMPTPNTNKSILRSSSTSSVTPSPKFSFDFVDDSLSLGGTSSINSYGRNSNANSRSNNGTSPRNYGGRTPSKLSPGRLDSRYSSRLPPSYGQSPHSSASYYMRSNSLNSRGEEEDGEVKRNLFGGEGNSIATNSSMASLSSNVMAMDVSSDGGCDSMSGISTPHGTTPSRGGVYNRSYSASAASPSHSRRSVNLSIATNTSTRSNVSTFMNSSPRKQGLVTGVTSPLSGNLSYNASVCSSAASSPANSTLGGGTYSRGGSAAGSDGSMLIDYEARSGAGDRYIPSRALSNFNFDLSTGGKRRSHYINTNGVNNGGSGRGASASAAETVIDTDILNINPQPSFGETMMGGGTIVDDTPTPAPAPDIDTVGSDDADDNEETERQDATNRQPLLYDALLRSELLGENIDPAAHSMQSPTGLVNSNINNGNIVTPFHERSNNLRFNPTRQYYHNSMFHNMNGRDTELSRENEHSSIVNSFQLSPVSLSSSQRNNLGSYTERCKRKIAKVPTKVLDAPALQDDFYLNLVDWSSQNVLAVGLGASVYLWSAVTSRVTQLTDMSGTEDTVTSVSWSESGKHLSIGVSNGEVQLWDAGAQKLIRTMKGHSARVGALSWKLSGSVGANASNQLLASGSRDRLIHLHDPRSDSNYEMRLCGHKQEVCGLRWSFDERSMLASGGNDNKLLVWDVKKHTKPIHTFADHTAAVKAIAWNPHQHGILASGGGTADRCIRFWNCLTGHGINCIDTGSQVCNLAFSKNCNELVSTHGYSLNQIGKCLLFFG